LFFQHTSYGLPPAFFLSLFLKVPCDTPPTAWMYQPPDIFYEPSLPTASMYQPLDSFHVSTSR
jgi:hypothetical protein